MFSKALILGNVGRDPETRYTKNGTLNVSFSVATNRRYTDQSGQQQEKTNWFRVTAWGKLADTLVKLTEQGYLTKGSKVFVSGRLDLSEYTNQAGENKSSLEIMADDVQLVGSRPEGRDEDSFRPREEAPVSDEVDDLPF